jgi:hypothetical protein
MIFQATILNHIFHSNILPKIKLAIFVISVKGTDLIWSVEHVEEESSFLGRLEHESDLETSIQLKSFQLNVTS